MKLLAVDQGSAHLGLAFFDGERVLWTKRISPPGGWPWRRRMRWITDHMRERLAGGEAPDVVAIEDIALGKFMRGLLTMGETRGWLMCALEHWYPGVRQVAIHPATVRAAVEAPRARAGALERYRKVAEFRVGARVSEDESAAVCIGIAAIARLRREGQFQEHGLQLAIGERSEVVS